MATEPFIVDWALWAPVSPPVRGGARFIDHGMISGTKRGATAKLAKEWEASGGVDAAKARGWTIEKITVSGGW